MGKRFIRHVGRILAVTCLVSGCEVYDLDKHATYASYTKAEAEGAVRRGWIPDFVPKSATEIQESHNLDVNTQWLTFRFEQEDLPAILEFLTPADPAELRFHRPDRKRPWWPGALLGYSSALEKEYDLYTYQYTVHFGGGPESYTAFVAIEQSQPRVWYWDPR